LLSGLHYAWRVSQGLARGGDAKAHSA